MKPHFEIQTKITDLRFFSYLLLECHFEPTHLNPECRTFFIKTTITFEPSPKELTQCWLSWSQATVRDWGMFRHSGSNPESLSSLIQSFFYKAQNHRNDFPEKSASVTCPSSTSLCLLSISPVASALAGSPTVACWLLPSSSSYLLCDKLQTSLSDRLLLIQLPQQHWLKPANIWNNYIFENWSDCSLSHMCFLKFLPL